MAGKRSFTSFRMTLGGVLEDRWKVPGDTWKGSRRRSEREGDYWAMKR